jgi:hypothetical protein
MGRQAKGVRLIRLDDGQTLAAVIAADEHQTPTNVTEAPTPQPLTAEEEADFADLNDDEEMEDSESDEEIIEEETNETE